MIWTAFLLLLIAWSSLTLTFYSFHGCIIVLAYDNKYNNFLKAYFSNTLYVTVIIIKVILLYPNGLLQFFFTCLFISCLAQFIVLVLDRCSEQSVILVPIVGLSVVRYNHLFWFLFNLVVCCMVQLVGMVPFEFYVCLLFITACSGSC